MDWKARRGVNSPGFAFVQTRLDGLAAELATVGCKRNFGEALRAGFVCHSFGALDAGDQFLYGKYEEEIDHERDD